MNRPTLEILNGARITAILVALIALFGFAADPRNHTAIQLACIGLIIALKSSK